MRALVLSGGGSKGAYQCGVLQYLLNDLGTQYNVLCGVSVGALNAALLAMYPLGQELKAFTELKNLWGGINTAKVYKKWAFWGELAALWKPSLYDSSPLQILVKTTLDVNKLRSSGKQLRVGAVALGTGEYMSFGQAHPQIADAVIASSAFPAMLTPVTIEGQLWTDGGVRSVTPLKEAIDLGANDIDVVMCSPKDSRQLFPTNSPTLKVAERAIDLMNEEIIADDLKVAEYVNQLVIAKVLKEKRAVN